MSQKYLFKAIIANIILASFIISVRLVVIAGEGLLLAIDAPFSSPSRPFDNSLLVGEWFTNYTKYRNELLVIFADGRFRQVYSESGTIIESLVSTWWIEQIPDGRVYLHLEGAKYYFDGMSMASDVHPPCPKGDLSCLDLVEKLPIEFFDWIGRNWVQVDNKLILNVRVDSSGDVVLLHLWKDSDRGFPIIGGKSEIFRKTNE